MPSFFDKQFVEIVDRRNITQGPFPLVNEEHAFLLIIVWDWVFYDRGNFKGNVFKFIFTSIEQKVFINLVGDRDHENLIEINQWESFLQLSNQNSLGKKRIN